MSSLLRAANLQCKSISFTLAHPSVEAAVSHFGASKHVQAGASNEAGARCLVALQQCAF